VPDSAAGAQSMVTNAARMSAWGDASVFFGTPCTFADAQHVQKKARAGNA